MRSRLFPSVLCAVFLVSPSAYAQTADADAAQARQGEAYRLFLVGRHLFRTEDIDGAIRSYREAAELDRASGEILAELAEVLVRSNRPDQAIETAEAALEREPANQSAHKILGRVYASRAMGQRATAQDARLAIEHLEQARATVLPDFTIELTLARLYLGNDAPDQAITLLEELLKDVLGFSEAGLLLSQAYEQVGRTEDAVTTLEDLVRVGRPSSRALRRLGELYERDGRWSDAVQVYEQAVGRNPRSPGTRRQLANALLQNGQADQARTVLDELIQMRPDDAAGLYLLSEVELELGNLGGAERAARRLIETEPGGLRGAFALAEVFARRRQHQNVIETLEPALEAEQRQDLQPNQVASVLGRIGFAYEQLQDAEGASRIYEQAVELMPARLAFGARLVQAYINEGRLSDARDALQSVQVHHPNNLTVARLQARVLGEGGDIDGGVDVLQKAIDNHEGEPMAYVALSGFYSEYERLEDAVELLESVQEQFPNDLSILFQLGAVLEQSDRYADAERTFRRILDHDPENAATLNYLGYMLADRGERLEESVGLLERAIEIDPHNGAYLDSLGWAYFKLDRLDFAETLLEAASAQMAWNSVIQDHLGDLLFRRGRYEEAIGAWKRALAGDGEEVERTTIERKIGDARRQLAR